MVETNEQRNARVQLEERVNLINGKFRINSEQGSGTKIEINIPLKA